MTSPGYAERKRQEIAQRAEKATMQHYDLRYGRHDRRMVHALGPSRAWRWIAPLIGVVGFLVVFAAMLADPFGVISLTAAVLYIAVLGPAIALARKTPICPICGREVPYRTPEEAGEAVRHDAESAPV